MTLKFVSVVIGIASLTASTDGLADDRAVAGNLFDAGAEAYDAGQYLVAAEAFLKAHTLLKSPALQFSAAQAYRRQYLVDASPDALRRAVRLYRDYLHDDAAGERREDAIKALADLVPIEARLPKRHSVSMAQPSTNPSDKPAPIPIPVPGTQPSTQSTPEVLADEPEESAEAIPRKTRLLISAKPAGAEVSVDGGALMRVPAVVEVKAGSHQIHAQAEGYFEDEFQIDAVEKELVARHVTLRPKPGRLTINGMGGATLSLDGQVRAVLPLEQPLNVEPGEHFISVTRPGRTSFTRFVSIQRDKQLTLDVPMAMTNQRIGAWSMFSIGAAGAVATGILGGLTWQQNNLASSLDAQRQTLSMTPSQIADFNTALALRNTYSTATLTTCGVSALMLLTSAGLFLFDNPATIPIPNKSKDSPNPPSRVQMTVGLGSVNMLVAF